MLLWSMNTMEYLLVVVYIVFEMQYVITITVIHLEHKFRKLIYELHVCQHGTFDYHILCYECVSIPV